MLDEANTRKNFGQWLKSPAFDRQFDSLHGKTRWPFVIGIILIVLGFLLERVELILISLFFLLHGYNRWTARRKARRDAHLAFNNYRPILCLIIIGNTQLLSNKGAVAPALLMGSFEPLDDEEFGRMAAAAELIGGLYGEDPATVPPEHQEACRMVNDDTFRPNRRRPVPAPLNPHHQFWLFDAILSGDHFKSGQIDDPMIPCMAATGPEGGIIHVPNDVIAISQDAHDPNIIHHKARTAPPPLVAPHSDNLEAVEEHITRNLGVPATVFHEIVSTTVHIDVHIVRATPERPWVSLVTSGMSDIPMNAPEGAEEFRFAELMIRLPADWKLGEESFKQEEHYWPVLWLKRLARFPHEYETWLSFGHSIPNGDPPEPLAPGMPFAGLVLSTPWVGGDDLATLRLADGTPVRFWSLIALHPSEIAFKLQHGSDALFEKLASAGYSDLFDPRRPAVA
jgi:hypothetical protein